MEVQLNESKDKIVFSCNKPYIFYDDNHVFGAMEINK